MSFQAKRELLRQVAPRYREASHAHKSLILDEFIASTGYARKYAIRILSKPVSTPAPITRPRPRRYGSEVQAALQIAWAAANFICAKRLVPFLAELVPSLERHGHLSLTDEIRAQLLAISPATADRILRATRQANRPRGIATTKAGVLLKKQIPIRTFSQWTDTQPGFFEADLVAHCGYAAEGAYLYTLTLTDVATGWTECLALLHRSQQAVVQALDTARQLLPFPILGIDTDNGSEFINTELLAYCQREGITFTRGRPYKKNDQCFVEQKNGAVVRELVGYDRFEGERSYRQLSEVYRAVRLYVNFFQPSMKLLTKRRTGSRLYRKYDEAQTPLQRLLASDTLSAEACAHLRSVAAALDPVRMLRQLQVLQEALWKQAVFRNSGSVPEVGAAAEAVRFSPQTCLPTACTIVQDGEIGLQLPIGEALSRKRKYQRSAKSLGPRTYRTRPDPFVAVNEELLEWVKAAPQRTAKSLFEELQQRYPGQFPDIQLRTLQRRVAGWRAEMIVEFDDGWLREEVSNPTTLAPVLRGRPVIELARETNMISQL